MSSERPIHAPRRTLAAVALLQCLACTSPGGGPGRGTEAVDPVVARVDGHEIALSAVDERIRDQLFEESFGEGQEAELHEARREAATELVDEYLIRRAAERADLTPEAWVAAQIAALPAVGDEEVAAFFETHRERLGEEARLEALSERIRHHLEWRQREEVMAALRSEADVVFVLPRERQSVMALGPSAGPEDAAVTLIEFSDYQCPFCARAEPTVKALLARYPTQLRLVYRHLPLDFHPQARGAAEAAVCAHRQERFWAYHDLLFADPSALGRESLLGRAQELGLDVSAFQVCLDDPATAERVQRDVEDARAAGATGTPTFFVNGIRLTGARPLEDFVALIERELARPQP